EYGLINHEVDMIGSISNHIVRSDLLSSLYYNSDDVLVTITATDVPIRHDQKNIFAVSRANHSEVKHSHLFDSPNNKFMFFETDLEAIRQLESGVANKAIVSLYTAEYYRKIASRPYKVSGRLNNESVERVFSVRADSSDLLQLVNGTLANSLPSYLSGMAYRWRYGPKPNLSVYAQYGHIIRPLLIIVLPCLLIYFFYSYRLARALKYRKKAESRLFAQLDIMQRFIDGIPHPVVLLKDDMTIIYRNRAFSETFGHKITNSDKYLSSYILDSTDLHHISSCVSEAIRLSDVLDHEVSIDIDGKRRDIQDWFIPYKDIHDSSVGVFWGWFDVTWRNEAYSSILTAKQEAESANQAKSEFIATISHELRTPINIISGFLEIFYKTRILTDSEREELDFVRTAANGLLELVGDVLDVTKIESGLLHLELEATDITKLLQDAVSMFKVTAQEKGVVIDDNFNAVLPDLLMLDPVRVRQVFYNILSNAVKFTSKGSIFVETQLNDDVLVVSVKDSGIGISEDKIDTLFQPFRQAHIDRHYQGSGLGLNIAKRLCELMGGSISLQSTLGVGTTIKVMLPCRWADADVSKAVTETQDAPRDMNIDSTNLRIIIVDDHPVNLILLGKQLRLLGFTVIQAETGKEVLDLLKVESVDAILTDCQMPEIDGYELTKRIRAYEKEVQCQPHTIIGITASGLKQDRERAIEAGMNECIFKPIDTDGLKKTLNIQLCQVIKSSEKAALSINTQQDSQLHLLILDTTKQDLSLSFECLLKDDYEQLSSLVHRIKGVYLMVRNPQVVTLCKEIEKELEHNRDTGFISEKLHEIERLIEVA
ncbi:MAG: ATP-binding protein, partial [Shewanella sp.]